jgi:hypothetical protein
MGGEESGKSSLLRAVVGQGDLPSRAAAGPASGSGRGRQAAARATQSPQGITAVLQTPSSDREGAINLLVYTVNLVVISLSPKPKPECAPAGRRPRARHIAPEASRRSCRLLRVTEKMCSKY